jgi:hypothetical protein
MAGLVIKEMKLREAIDRILILCPAPLTIQWRDELLRWFNEPFDMIFSAVDQQQLVNPWQRAPQVIASLDYAKQDSVRERVWHVRWGPCDYRRGAQVQRVHGFWESQLSQSECTLERSGIEPSRRIGGSQTRR